LRCVLAPGATALAQDDSDALEGRVAELEAKIARLEAQCTAASSSSAPRPDPEQTLTELTRRVRAMKPASAAYLLSTLDQDLARDIFQRLDRRSAARILDRMPTSQAAAMFHAVAAEADLVSTPKPEDATQGATGDAGGEDSRDGGS